MPSSFPESGVKLVAETDSYTSAMEEAISLAEQVEGIGDVTISVSAELDTSTLDVSELSALEGEAIPITAELDVTETETAKKTLSAVETLKNLKIIETVWNIAGTAVDFLGKIESFAVEPLLSVEDAVARVNAQTNFAIPNADKLINDIFYDDLGNSIDQVGEMVTAASQLKAPVDEAVRSALAFTKVFDDQNPIDVLNTLNQMVGSGLAKDFTEAGDLLTTAFQNGGNRANDLLTAINNNAVAIKDLGLTGPQALSAITTGLDNGFKSANEVVSALAKIKQNVTAAAGNEDSDVSKTLDLLGIANPAETGEAWSADFFTSVIDGINALPGLTDTQREAMITNLLGDMKGTKTASAVLGLDVQDVNEVFSNVSGAASRAGVAIDDSLHGAIDDFVLAAQQAATEFLSSEQIDLPGKIAALKTGLQDGLDTLAEGGTLGEALTVALKPIGFDDEFQGLESMLGNFVIALLQVVASIQGATRNFDQADATNLQIAKLSAEQFAFDITVGNPDELSTEISTALSRGVSAGTVAETLSNTVGGLIESGALAQAQAIVDSLKNETALLEISPDITGLQLDAVDKALKEGGSLLQDAVDAGLVISKAPELSPEAVAGLQANIDAAVEASQGSVEELIDADFGLNLETAATKATELATAAETTVAPVEDLTAKTATQGTTAATAAPAVAAVASATKDQTNAALASFRPISILAGSLSSVAGTAPVAASGLGAVNGALTSLIATAKGLAGAGAPTTGKALGGNASGTFEVGELGPEIITTDRNLAVLNNRTTEQIMAALNQYIPGGSFTGRGGNSFSVNNTNIVQSEAQADALGFSTAAQIRGMAMAQ